ncbi:Y+L amino acid transporter 2-like [Bolinopsis microptera]|uniref:Y+L amino acid transporter 2-like n=1 Tax=Bolinopsis microptera TaxID=2820187 RepID=UPI003079A1D1
MLPKNGGQMIYLRKAFGGLLSFLSCYLLHVLLGGLRRAIGFLTFGKYFWAVFYDNADDVPEWANRILCIVVCWTIMSLITIYPNLTLKIIDAVTFFKMASLALIIILGFVHLCQGHTENITVGFENTSWKPQEWGEAWNSVLWAYNGWISLSVMLGEVKDPRMLPKIVAISMTIVTILYVLAVTSYHIVLDMDTMMSGSALASKLAGKKMGQSGEVFYAIAVAVSTLGNAMCASLAASRFLQAGGRGGILPGCFGLVNKRFKTPMFSLLYVMVASTIFISFGNVFKLINTASFTSFAFTSLCAVGLLVMRRKFPDLPRPVQVSLLYPIATIVMGVYLFIIPWITNWSMCLLWTGLTLAGVPVYFVCVRGYYRPKFFVSLSESFTSIAAKILNSE